jgi:hypothetical protein
MSHHTVKVVRRIERHVRMGVIESHKSESSIDAQRMCADRRGYVNENLNPSIINLSIQHNLMHFANKS